MKSMLLEPTATAQWQALVKEAEASRHLSLGEELESYLVFLLMRFVEKAELAKSVLAMEYLQAFETLAGQGVKLQEVGDKCLLLAGLFPERAERKRVQISYFVELGRSAYSRVADLSRVEIAGLYQSLCESFVALMDVLHITRELAGNALTPLQAMHLWKEVKSPHALEVLQQHTKGILLFHELSLELKH